MPSKCKTLKIGFAMGGGVSLGSFSGAALTESIKQLIVYSTYTDDNGKTQCFDDFEIDVFSGASAGAVSLAIMLRMFFNYEDKLHLLFGKGEFINCDSNEELLAKIQDKLIKQFEEDFFKLTKKKQTYLITAQVAQEFQRYLWVNEADIEPLAGIEKGNEKDLRYLGSILDRQHLLEMAKKTFLFDDKVVFNRKGTLLAKRVLFANTLTRVEDEKLSSVKHFSKNSKQNNPKLNDKLEKLYEYILADGTTSHSHKDIRVFDLNFDKIKENRSAKFPQRWMKYHLGAHHKMPVKSNEPCQELLPMKKNAFWASIASTALAAGAFPIAFQQVPLKRHAYEYGKKYFDLLGEEKPDHIFTYIDGGTFNNEPISEAFRLSAFIDSRDKDKPGEDYERFLIYVDPLIGSSENEVKDYFREYKTNEAKAITEKRNGLEKIVSFLSPMIGILRQEGAVSEMDKSVSVLNKFNVQSNLRNFYAQTVMLGLKDNISGMNEVEKKVIETQIKSTIKAIRLQLGQLQQRMTIPSVSVSIDLEIKRLLSLKNSAQYYPNLQKQLDKKKQVEIISGYTDFFEGDPFQATYFPEWLIALFHIALDIGLDLTGKNEYTQLIPIGPLMIDEGGDSFKEVDLNGKKLSGFYGFMDMDIRNSDFDQGRVCTVDLMKYVEIISPDAKPIVKTPFVADEQEVMKRIDEVLEKRVKEELIGHNFKDILTFQGSGISDKMLDTLASALISRGRGFVKSRLRSYLENSSDAQGIFVEFRISIPNNSNFEIADAQAKYTVPNISSRLVNGKHKIISTVIYLDSFKSAFIEPEKQQLHIVRPPKLMDAILNQEEIVLSLPVPQPALAKNLQSYSYPIFRIDLRNVLNSQENIDQFKEQLTLGQEIWSLEQGIHSLEDEINDDEEDENSNMPT